MAIVLEGMDNTGKSTLAKELSELTGWPVIHAGGPIDLKDIEERLHNDFALMQQKVIMDRSVIISDTIYSKVLRGDVIFDIRPWIGKMLALEMHDPTFKLIFCTAAEATVCSMTNHIVKAHETEEHVRQVEQKKHELYWTYNFMYNALCMFFRCESVNPRTSSELALVIAEEMQIPLINQSGDKDVH